jgi:hypothetical protein
MNDREKALEAFNNLLYHVEEILEYGVWVDAIRAYLEKEQ